MADEAVSIVALAEERLKLEREAFEIEKRRLEAARLRAEEELKIVRSGHPFLVFASVTLLALFAFAGGMLLGAIFMATDMVTSPMSAWGKIIFGIGCGLLTIIIRVWGSYPEGVSFAILLMNAVVPLINKGFPPKRFGSATVR